MFNHTGKSATVIDAKNASVVATIPLDGSPEFAVADAATERIYCNLEDKSEVAVIDAAKHEVVARWALAPGEEPTGIALDAAHHRLFSACHNKLMANDNWKNTQQAQIMAAGLAPPNDNEAALIAPLPAGNYNAVVSGKNGGIGVALAEVYDLDPTSNSRLANISTRANVGTGSDVLIGGFTTGNNIGATRVAIRALGPSLQQFGIANPLPDPQLALTNANGTVLASDDNWQTHPAQAAAIISYGLAPSNNLESAIAISLAPGSYTAIVSGKNNQTGIALIEVYDEQ